MFVFNISLGVQSAHDFIWNSENERQQWRMKSGEQRAQSA